MDRRSGRDRRRQTVGQSPLNHERRVTVEPRQPEVIEIEVTRKSWMPWGSLPGKAHRHLLALVTIPRSMPKPTCDRSTSVEMLAVSHAQDAVRNHVQSRLGDPLFVRPHLRSQRTGHREGIPFVGAQKAVTHVGIKKRSD